MKRKDFIKQYSRNHYLGDGLYVSFDGFHFILSAEREPELLIGLDLSHPFLTL